MVWGEERWGRGGMGMWECGVEGHRAGARSLQTTTAQDRKTFTEQLSRIPASTPPTRTALMYSWPLATPTLAGEDV